MSWLPLPSDFVVPDTIDNTGSKDVSADLQAWIENDIDPVAVVRFAPAFGVYRCEQELEIAGDKRWEVRGSGCTFLRTVTDPAARAHWRFEQSQVDMWNVRVQGPAPASAYYQAAYESQAAFRLASAWRCKLHYCSADGVWGDFVSASKARPDERWTGHVEIDHCTVGIMHRDFIAATGVDDLYAHDFSVARCRTFLDLEPNSDRGGATNIHLENGSVAARTGNFISCIAAGGHVGNVVVRGVHSGSPLSTVVSMRDTGVASQFVIDLCDSPAGSGNGKGATLQFTNVQAGPNGEPSVSVTNVSQRLNPNRNMEVARFWNCQDPIIYSGCTPPPTPTTPTT